MKKERNLIIGIVLMVVIIGLVVFEVLDNKSVNSNHLKTDQGIMALQSKKEEKFATKGYTIDKPNIIIDPYDRAPLTALVLFETKDEVKPIVTIVGKDELTTFKHEFKKGKEHYLEIFGLYPDYENKVIIEYGKVKKELNIKTEKLPKGFILPTKVKAQKDKLNNDLYFISPSGMNYPCAYDVNGDVRWYLKDIALWENARLENGHFLVGTNRLINMPYYVTGLYEMDLFGKIYKEYSLPGGYHHDFEELPNGNFLVASNDFNNIHGTVEDYIVEISKDTGDILRTYDLKDILKMDDGKSENWINYDWFHNNSVWYDKKTNSITLSGRHKDCVINIDYKTGKLNWIIGDKTNWDKEYHKYFFTPVGKNFEWQWSQHAAMITPEGYVFLFDNGNNKSKIKANYVPASKSYSRGVMYKIDTDKMTIEQVYEYGKERGYKFYSPYISDVDYLEKDHYIIHSGGIVYDENGHISNQPAGFVKASALVSDTVEVLNDEVIYELVLPTNNYRVEKQSLYNDTNLELKKGKELGSLGKTKVIKEKKGIVKSNKIDKEYKKHQIKLTKEKDRLSISGLFKLTDEVNIILYKNLNSKYYHVNVSKKPYTALCVNVFTEEETKNGINITRFINDEGLKGKYSIYIEINGKIYNTEKYIKID